MATRSLRKPRDVRPYNSPLRQAQSEQTRLLLVTSAERFLRENGTEGFSLPAVARMAGVSHATAYKHFTDDDALLLTVVEEHRKVTGASLFESDLPPERLFEVPLITFPLLDADLGRSPKSGRSCSGRVVQAGRTIARVVQD
jgi:AcrR family transcriptional regulator